MLNSLAQALHSELADLENRHRFRRLPELSGDTRTHASLAGKPVVSFASNDYLGLAAHPALPAAVTAAIADSGFGAGASRLVSGDLPAHRALERDLARFLGTESALLFPTGYQTNLGVLQTLAGPEDLIVSDALNHASLIDGCRLSRASVRVFPHLNVDAAADALSAGRHFRRRLLVTESVFSMDGDLAPLDRYAELARANDAVLVVDEAHAVGVLGPGGRGVASHAGVKPDVLIGTLGKAFGAFGGFVAGDAVLRDALVNRARTFLFTTAAPPALAAAASAALALLAGSEGETRRRRLADHVTRVREQLGFPPLLLPTPIVPVILGTDAAALRASAVLLAAGLFVQPIRPPTVPEGTARLRVTLSASHTDADVTALLAALTLLR